MSLGTIMARFTVRCLLLGGLAACAERAQVAGQGLLAGSSQHVLVIVERDDDSTGLLYQMANSGSGWRQAGAPIPVSVGSAGVAKTREGDRRAPTGVYRLGTVFGYADTAPAGTRMPYLPLLPETECVDDAESSHYNRIVNPSGLPGGKTWSSSEMMRRDIHNGDDLYKLGILVEYDAGKGGGSCIFLHIWRGPQRPTVGCTAFPEAGMNALVMWLDPRAMPVLVQASREDLERLVADGTLPYALPAREAAL